MAAQNGIFFDVINYDTTLKDKFDCVIDEKATTTQFYFEGLLSNQ